MVEAQQAAIEQMDEVTGVKVAVAERVGQADRGTAAGRGSGHSSEVTYLSMTPPRRPVSGPGCFGQPAPLELDKNRYG